jgi:hypothetical protein
VVFAGAVWHDSQVAVCSGCDASCQVAGGTGWHEPQLAVGCAGGGVWQPVQSAGAVGCEASAHAFGGMSWHDSQAASGWLVFAVSAGEVWHSTQFIGRTCTAGFHVTPTAG